MKELEARVLPLSDIKVVEFCTVAAGPFCGMLLADMGADLIKVEAPGGDSLRAWPPFTDGYSENFASLNRNKQSVVLDLKVPSDNEFARQLILDADVVIENNRPGVMKRLGLDYGSFSDQKPNLVYCSISAYGQTGPRADEGGFDLTIQAAAGVMSVTGETSGLPVKCGVPISDFASGLYAAYAIAAKIADVRGGGTGAHIDVPMFGCTLGVAALQTSEYFGSGRDPVKLGSAHPRNSPYQAYQASDGYFTIAAGNQKLWLAVCNALGLMHLFDDARFLTTSDRARNQAALKEILEECFMQETVDHWIQVFNRAAVPHARINTYSQALSDPQVDHMGWVQNLALPGGRQIRSFASPLKLDGKTLPIRMNPPSLGEHTVSVRASMAEKSNSEQS